MIAASAAWNNWEDESGTFLPTSNSSELLLLLWLFSWSWRVIYDTKMWKQNYKIRQDFALCEPDKLKCFKWVDGKQTEELCNGQKQTLEDAHVWKGLFFWNSYWQGSRVPFYYVGKPHEWTNMLVKVFSLHFFRVSAHKAAIPKNLSLLKNLNLNFTEFSLLTKRDNFSTVSWPTPFSWHVPGQKDMCLSNFDCSTV